MHIDTTMLRNRTTPPCCRCTLNVMTDIQTHPQKTTASSARPQPSGKTKPTHVDAAVLDEFKAELQRIGQIGPLHRYITNVLANATVELRKQDPTVDAIDVVFASNGSK